LNAVCNTGCREKVESVSSERGRRGEVGDWKMGADARHLPAPFLTIPSYIYIYIYMRKAAENTLELKFEQEEGNCSLARSW
jgi:hypothetical protein